MPIKLYLIFKNCDKIVYNTQYLGNCVLWLKEDIYPFSRLKFIQNYISPGIYRVIFSVKCFMLSHIIIESDLTRPLSINDKLSESV